MAYSIRLAVMILASTLAASALGQTFFFDSFESGDMSATNAEGFQWAGNNRTSVVTSTAVVYNNGVQNTPIPSGRNWEAKTGEHSLRFLYEPNKAWTEQRFRMGKAYPELWMGFWLRVPLNYSHPTVSSASDNQKLFALWMDDYSSKGEGSTVSMEFRGSGGGSSYFYGKISSGGYTVTGRDLNPAPFIDVPRDRGRWMHLVVHIVSETSPGAKDGTMQVWRKWESESDYTKTHDIGGQPIRLSSSVRGFAAGYLMGWANAEYPVVTEFLLDDFELGTTPLFSAIIAPNPPSNISID